MTTNYVGEKVYYPNYFNPLIMDWVAKNGCYVDDSNIIKDGENSSGFYEIKEIIKDLNYDKDLKLQELERIKIEWKLLNNYGSEQRNINNALGINSTETETANLKIFFNNLCKNYDFYENQINIAVDKTSLDILVIDFSVER